MSKKIKNVFISHHGKDDEYVDKFKKLLDKSGYSIRNSSIDSTKPNEAMSEEYIKSILRQRIEWASVTVVLIGHETAERDWVNWEVEFAEKKDKRIIGVYLPGATDADLPENLDAYADSILGWQSGGIIDAIEADIDPRFEKPDGTPCPSRDDSRGVC